MTITLRDRKNEYRTVSYRDPLSIICDRADALFNPSDVAGNGLEPAEMLLQVRLPRGEQATFTASRWEILFPGEAI